METSFFLRRGKRWIAGFLLAMAIVHLIVLYQDRELIASGYGDFSAFYTAGLMMRRGMSRQLYVPHEQWKLQQEFAHAVKIRQGPMPYVRPPFEALLFLPLAYCSYPTALAIWTALKLGFLYLTFRILPRTYPPWLELVLSLGFFPVFLDLYQGQDATFLLFLVALAFRQLCVQRDAFAGVVLALGLFKFHLILPVVIMLSLAGRPRVLRGFIPVALGLVAISIWIAGPEVLRSYPAYLIELNRATGAGMVTAQSMPNLRGLLTGWVGRAPYPGPIHWLLLPIGVLALGSTVWIWRGARPTDSGLALGYSLAPVVAILTSYYAYTYDLILLLIPVLILSRGFRKKPASSSADMGIVACGLFLLYCSPLYWFLILRVDRPYLLAFPVLLLALGIASILRKLASQHEPYDSWLGMQV